VSLNIGDVEAKVFINGTVVERSQGPNVKVEQMEARNERITFTTVDVSPPYPSEFWVNFQIRSEESYGKQPVVLRGRMLRDESLLGEFHTVLGRDATRGYTASPPLHSYSCDILAGLDAVPESVLVLVEADVLLMSPGTPEASVDPVTAEVEAEFRATIRSNPLRVNFVGGPAPLAELPAADAVPPADVPSPEEAVATPPVLPVEAPPADAPSPADTDANPPIPPVDAPASDAEAATEAPIADAPPADSTAEDVGS